MVRRELMLMIAVLAIAWGCSTSVREIHSDTQSVAGYTWTKVLDSAQWAKSYNFQLITFRDTLWCFHPKGTWASVDGIHWKKTPLKNAISNLAFLDYLVFKDQVLGMGHFTGNVEKYKFTPNVYSTQNLRTWDSVDTQLPEVFFAHPFVFRDSLWLAGGYSPKGDVATLWNSADGKNWNLVSREAPFGKRSGSLIVSKNDTLFLLNNDVWISTDARHWSLWAKEIWPGEEIFGYSAVVYDQQIWLMGCNRNGLFSSEVLSSFNGRDWSASEAPWSARGGVATALFRGSIYLTGGKYGGLPNAPDFQYSNDVWRFTRNSGNQ